MTTGVEDLLRSAAPQVLGTLVRRHGQFDACEDAVQDALIEAALKAAKRAKAPALEAYPLDAALSPSSSSTGYATTFARAGFIEVARHFPPRPIMRYDFTT